MYLRNLKKINPFSKKNETSKFFRQQYCSRIGNVVQKSSNSNEINNIHPRSAQVQSFGQPTFFTHPFLLSEGEVLPGLKVEEFQERRKNFMELIFADSLATYGKSIHNVVIIPSATKLYMTEKIPYIFHQNTDFLYLTGCLEPDTALVMSGSSTDDMVSTLFLRKSDSHSEMWDGPRTGTDVAPLLFGIDEAFSVSELRDFLDRKITKYANHPLYYDLTGCRDLALHSLIIDHIKKFNIMVCRSCKNFIDKLRVKKSPAEQNLMRKAAEISSFAIEEAMKISHPDITEHQLFATIDYKSRMLGAEILAYPPVVASGKNANIIHYIANNQILKDGDLILIDAGCEYHNYCGDITRTWPVNGKFSKYQRILYEIVLEVQKQLISACEERLSLDLLYQKMIFLLTQYLQSEKILTLRPSDHNLNEISRELCCHHVSHYLGMDIHDVRTIHKDIPLVPGMVITVEPGLYTKENLNVAPEFWNLGIRVEDDILITDTGYEVLSAPCPKEVHDIEKILERSI